MIFLRDRRRLHRLLADQLIGWENSGDILALALIEVDDFPLLNIRYGHAFGDLFWEHLQETLGGELGEHGVLVRLEGAGLAVLLTGCGRDEAVGIVRRLVDAAAGLRVMTTDWLMVSVTVSGGLAISPDHGDRAGDLLAVAEKMLARAREQGGDNLSLPEAADVVAVRRQRRHLVRCLGHALVCKSVLPYFQPICHLGGGQALGHEVLMRIPSDGWKIITAAEFVDDPEHAVTLRSLDLALLANTLPLLTGWPSGDKLFFNLTTAALLDHDFLAAVATLVREHKVAPQRLVFEVRDWELSANPVAYIETFIAWSRAGFGLAVDGFADTVEALRRLGCLPLSYLKLRREYVAALVADPAAMRYLGGVVEAASLAGIKTVASFVEDKELAVWCRILGVEYGQGYHLGVPVPRGLT